MYGVLVTFRRIALPSQSRTARERRPRVVQYLALGSGPDGDRLPQVTDRTVVRIS
jgi:hypothetical protein